MRTTGIALAAIALAAATPAAAQLSNRSVALEPGLSAPAGGAGGARPSFALAASAWLDGDVEAVARVAFGSAAETAGREAAVSLCATAGLRLTLAPDPLRPQVQLEIGWTSAGEGVTRGLAIGAGGGLEWFPARDLSLAARVALRGAPGALRIEASIAAAAYF